MSLSFKSSNCNDSTAIVMLFIKAWLSEKMLVSGDFKHSNLYVLHRKLKCMPTHQFIDLL